MKVKIDVMKDGTKIDTISRIPWMEVIGNFNPMFCRYQKKRTLVYSYNGDLSDAFRRDDNYLRNLYIKV